MVRGLESFRSWFKGYEDNYAIIGGTACDLLMSEAEIDFRLTRDIDMVLIVEELKSYVLEKAYVRHILYTKHDRWYDRKRKSEHYKEYRKIKKKGEVIDEIVVAVPNVVFKKKKDESNIKCDENVQSESPTAETS